MLPYLFWWSVGGLVGWFIGRDKEKSGLGLFMGLLLGPIGWIIMLLIPNNASSAKWMIGTFLVGISLYGIVISAEQKRQERQREYLAELKRTNEAGENAKQGRPARALTPFDRAFGTPPPTQNAWMWDHRHDPLNPGAGQH